MLKREDIQIRDPAILKVCSEKKYYLYGTTDKNCWGAGATGFNVYSSEDLENFEGPFEVFHPAKDFWATHNFWAPEVYQYNNKYYMFASFKADGVCRGTQILVSDSPKGPFVPWSDRQVTPLDWECLDGTLFVDEKKQPWMVFAREWLQVYDGEMWVIKLTKDLKRADGEPVLLFSASKASWCRGAVHDFTIDGVNTLKKVYVTDGPFVYKAENGELLMLWSSGGEQGYAMGVARSTSGNIVGPWVHDTDPLYFKDGGHGMIFKTFEGNVMLTIHTPNKTPTERPVFLDLYEDNGKLFLNS